MSWVTVIWSIGAGACLTLAVIYIVVWWKVRTVRANLVFAAFAAMATAVVAFLTLELAKIRAQTPEQFRIVARWVPAPGDYRVAGRLRALHLWDLGSITEQMSTRVRRSISILESANLEGDSSFRVDAAQGRCRERAIR
jgi:ABC-type Fe3+-siderophore transport system permease subunit